MSNINQARQETIFQTVPGPNVQKSIFDLSHDVKLTFKMGQLIPFLTLETLPNDQFRIGHEIFMRFAPLYFPIMHRINITMQYFWVPNRIIWESYPPHVIGKRGWEDFIAESEAAVEWAHVKMTEAVWNDIATFSTIDSIEATTLFEYMGARQPPNMADVAQLNKDRFLSVLPLMAYWKIWDDFYRRPQLQSELKYRAEEGDNIGQIQANVVVTDYEEFFLPVYRNWNLDYFTAALPQPQAGSEVLIPIVDENLLLSDLTPIKGPTYWRDIATDDPSSNAGIASATISGQTGGTTVASTDAYLDIQGSAATIRQFRVAARTQEFLERRNRTGNRYRDVVAGNFGVDPSAGVVDYAEFIGSSSGTVNIQDVTATALTFDAVPDPVSPVGSYAGKAIAAQGANNVVQYWTKEHGFIIGLINVQPRTSYMDTCHKFWLRDDKYDYAWPDFARIGDMAIKNRELAFFYSDAPLNPLGDFGYIDRFASYKYMNDITTGEFKNVWKDWHLARDITASAAVLDSAFLKSNPRELDIFAIADGTHPIFCHVWNKISASRNLPKHGIPSLSGN